MLEKIGIVYYLLGNIELSEYYHRMAEKGIPHYEREAYLQQYDAKL